MAHILIVEDETIIRSALRRLLERNQYQVSEAGSVQEAQERYTIPSFDMVVSDLRLPGAPGTELIKLAEGIPVLIMTSYASLRSAVDSMKMGAVDYIAKPFDHDEMLQAVARILKDRQENRSAAPVSANGGKAGGERGASPAAADGEIGIIGSCAPMQELYSKIRKVAPTDSTVLIQGESGTGKELVARALHNLSKRAKAPLISVNCAAIPETLIESELFGHEKGAFTGASAGRAGLVEAADGGTLFEDLYYRLHVISLKLPALRERGNDVMEIARAFLARQCTRMGRAPLSFAHDAEQAIRHYPWPGNVRELENAIERAVILSESQEIHADLLGIDIELDDLEDDFAADLGLGPAGAAASNHEPTEDLSLEDYFQHFVLEHQDHMTETELARKLGISRKCLWERRQRLGIPRRKSGASADS